MRFYWPWKPQTEGMIQSTGNDAPQFHREHYTGQLPPGGSSHEQMLENLLNLPSIKNQEATEDQLAAIQKELNEGKLEVKDLLIDTYWRFYEPKTKAGIKTSEKAKNGGSPSEPECIWLDAENTEDVSLMTVKAGEEEDKDPLMEELRAYFAEDEDIQHHSMRTSHETCVSSGALLSAEDDFTGLVSIKTSEKVKDGGSGGSSSEPERILLGAIKSEDVSMTADFDENNDSLMAEPRAYFAEDEDIQPMRKSHETSVNSGGELLSVEDEVAGLLRALEEIELVEEKISSVQM